MLITEEQRTDYLRDGVVCIRRVVEAKLIEQLRAEQDELLSSESGIELGGDELRLDTDIAADDANRSWQAFNGWKHFPGYRALVFGSALARATAELMGSRQVQLLYDHSFNKEPGSPIPIPWHQDITFWPVSGTQICSAWVALDKVTRESGAVHFVRGSHAWTERFRPSLELNAETANIANMNLSPAPDYFAKPGSDLISWEMEPGDAVIFSANTLHGSAGNTSPDRARRAISPRFIGDDVRFVEGIHVLTPLLDETPWLKQGDRLSGPEFPLAWGA